MRVSPIAIILAILLASSLTFVSLSIPSALGKQTISVSVTTVPLPELELEPLNYSAYWIRGPGISTFNLAYPTFTPSQLKATNMSSGALDHYIENGSGYYSMTSCGESLFESRITSATCGIEVGTSEGIDILNGTISTFEYTITVLNKSMVDGIYLLYPPGSSCGDFIVLIVGSQVPATLTNLISCPGVPIGPVPDVWVTGFTNMTGLNLTRS